MDRTFTDRVSGKDLNRPQLEAMLGFVRDGDTVLVAAVDGGSRLEIGSVRLPATS